MAIIVTTKKHASSHKNAGLDQILLDEFGTPNDNTNLDASTTRHGLLKKLNNIATQYLNGQGNFTTPPDTGEVNTASNVGTGSGWFKTKNLLDLQFKSLIANSNKLSLTANTNDITLDVAEGNLTLGNIGGTIGTSKITDDAVTYAKMQNISATARLVGRITSGAGDTEELTGTQATTLLDVFTSALKGLVPSSGGGSTNYLRADGTWATPAGGGGGTEYDYIEQARQRVGFIEDFIDVGSSSNYAVTASGTGATVVNVDTVDLGTFGVAQATTGTTSSARAGVYFSSGTISHQIVRFGQGITTMEAKIRIPTLSTSGEEFKVEFGLSDDATSS